MGTKVKVKPVQPTEIKEKAMVEQVIREVRRRPTKAQLAKMEEQDARFLRMIKK